MMPMQKSENLPLEEMEMKILMTLKIILLKVIIHSRGLSVFSHIFFYAVDQLLDVAESTLNFLTML